MKKIKLVLISLLTLGFVGCATLSEPIKEIKPGQAAVLKKQLMGKTLQSVINEYGTPASQGHYGGGELNFALIYPSGNDGQIATWQFNMKNKNPESNGCYLMLFNKGNNHELFDVTERDCTGPSRLDWDYVKAAK